MPRLPERLWGLPVLPVTLQAWRALQGRLLFYACTTFLLFLAFRPGEWGDKATIIQAFTAIVLIWATYQSIRRSDDQVEAAQSQIKIAQEQLEAAQKSGEAHHLSCSLNEKLELVLANLSALPIQLESVVEYRDHFDGHLVHDSAPNLILRSGEVFHTYLQTLADSELMASARHYADMYVISVGSPDEQMPNDPLSPYTVSVSYRYGGTGSRFYTKNYKVGISINTNAATTNPNWPYIIYINLVAFYYSFTTGTTDNGKYHVVDIPDTELVRFGTSESQTERAP